MRSCPEFERMLVRSGITLIKYWFSVSDEEQERRFQARLDDPMRRWKLSPMDLESARAVGRLLAREGRDVRLHRHQAGALVRRERRRQAARAARTASPTSCRWIPYEDLTPPPIDLPPRQPDQGYVRPPISDQTFVPEVY